MVDDLLAEDEEQQVNDERDVMDRLERQQVFESEIPDRVEDIINCVGRGYAISLVHSACSKSLDGE